MVYVEAGQFPAEGSAEHLAHVFVVEGPELRSRIGIETGGDVLLSTHSTRYDAPTATNLAVDTDCGRGRVGCFAVGEPSRIQRVR